MENETAVVDTVTETIADTVPTTEVETVTCNDCGCHSTLPALFRKSGSKRYCPSCALKVEIRNTKVLFAVMGAVLFMKLLADGVRYGWTSWQAWSLFITILIVIFSLVFHELSHALAAKLLGGQVFGIQLGIGRQVVRRWYNDFFLGINLFLVSGVCFAAFPTNKRLRLRYGLYIFGGLFFHVVTLAVVVPLFGQYGGRFPVLAPIIIINGLLFLLNIWPRTATTAVGQSGSDGMLLWRLARGTLGENELKRNYYRLAATFAFQQQKNEQVSRYIREGLLLNPGDELLENLRVYLLLNLEDKLEEAHLAWKNIVESETLEAAHGLHQAIFYNNYAWTTLMLRPEADSLEVARKYSEKAFGMAPWIPVLKGTLAAVMVEQGEHMQAVEWALEVVEAHEGEVSPERDKSIAANLATAALGYYRMGGRETAVQYLERAKGLAPEERMVQKVVAEIEGGGQAGMPAVPGLL